jgi:murein DD-endopeptidase MepM/ murein hydrolase activator NlpD
MTSTNGIPQKSAWQQRFLPCLGLVGAIGLLNHAPSPIQAAELVIPETMTAPAPRVAPLPQATTAEPVPFIPNFSPKAVRVPAHLEAPTVVLPGADAGYDAPTAIVFSERSTGCQATLQSGRALPDGICPPVQTWESPRTAGITSRVSAMGVVTPSPSVLQYYRRTLRPQGRLGNGNIQLMFPLAIPASISSMFGWRTHPITGDQRFHSGTDLAAPLGTPVLAAYAGQVALADFLGGYGLAIALEHNKGTQQTVYAHLSEIFVKPGERVKQGDAIGRVGSTGNSTGPHLHFEFRQLTPEGWVAMDAGQQLEYALAQLVKAIQVAQAKTSPVGKG